MLRPMVSSVALWLCVTSAVEAQPAAMRLPPPPPPKFAGESLPTPPQQAAPWEPPATELSPAWIEATRVLFEHGLADPRGCEYRQVEVVVGSVWGGGGVVQVHGWVLPLDGGATPEATAQRFAVCWNGLVYPVVRVGEPVDLQTHLDRLLEIEWGTEELGHAYPEHRYVQADFPVLLKVCLVLRLGHGDEAARMVERLAESWLKRQREWAQRGIKTAPATVQEAPTLTEHPLPHLARHWNWTQYDRAVVAHMRGDDAIARLTCEPLAVQLAPLRAAVERVAIPDPNRQRELENHGDGFLNNVDRLLRDQRRRAEATQARAAAAGDEVARLIAQLEEVAVTQGGQPGGVNLSESPILRSLKQAGDSAVEPLLAVLAADDRLTRSVGFHRDFFTHRHIFGVDEAALAALRLILESNTFGPLTQHGYDGDKSAEDRAAVVAEVRAYWEQRRGLTTEERWFRTLQDDQATESQWSEAAVRIVTAADVRLEGGWTITREPRPDPLPQMRGESLRAKTAPTVSELLAKRSDEIAVGEPGHSLDEFDVSKAINVARCLAKWEPGVAGPVLQRRADDTLSVINNRQARIGSSYEMLDGMMADLASAAIRVGDAATVDKFCRWLREYAAAAPSKEDRFDLNDLMSPLWEGRDLRAIQELTAFLFESEQSRWNPVHRAKPSSFYSPEKFAASPLILCEPFRRQLARLLEDASDAGSAETKDYSVTVRWLDRGTGYGMSWEEPRPGLPERVAVQTVRICDLYAWSVSRIRGCPRFELYWPLADRDAALPRVREFLSHWGPLCTGKTEFGRDPEARLRLPRLDHPATEADVSAGRAIFSLAPAAAELVPLEQYPQPARWTTLDDPLQTAPWAVRKRGEAIEYDQKGYVWQAERVQEGGEWKVYYGFIGRHVIARVPAAEIELLPKNTIIR